MKGGGLKGHRTAHNLLGPEATTSQQDHMCTVTSVPDLFTPAPNQTSARRPSSPEILPALQSLSETSTSQLFPMQTGAAAQSGPYGVNSSDHYLLSSPKANHRGTVVGHTGGTGNQRWLSAPDHKPKASHHRHPQTRSRYVVICWITPICTPSMDFVTGIHGNFT